MSEFTRTHRRAYSTASEPATSHPVGPWFAPLRSDDRRIADMAPLLVLVLFRRRQELSTPALHSAYTAHPADPWAYVRVDRLSWAGGWNSRAGPRAKPSSRFVFTRVTKRPAAAEMWWSVPSPRCPAIIDSTQRIVPEANTPAPLDVV